MKNDELPASALEAKFAINCGNLPASCYADLYSLNESPKRCLKNAIREGDSHEKYETYSYLFDLRSSCFGASSRHWSYRSQSIRLYD